jgi:transcription elongation factor Elf1
MIETVFDMLSHTGEPDDAIIQMKCKQCAHEFEVRLFILKPVNCRHLLGESLTITCPNCNAEGTTTEIEGKVAALQGMIDEIKAQFSGLFDQQLKFEPLGLFDKASAVGYLRCTSCGNKFKVDLVNNINCTRQKNSLTTACPNCNAADTLPREQAVQRITMFLALEQIKKYEQAIDLVKKGENKYAEI